MPGPILSTNPGFSSLVASLAGPRISRMQPSPGHPRLELWILRRPKWSRDRRIFISCTHTVSCGLPRFSVTNLHWSSGRQASSTTPYEQRCDMRSLPNDVKCLSRMADSWKAKCKVADPWRSLFLLVTLLKIGVETNPKNPSNEQPRSSPSCRAILSGTCRWVAHHILQDMIRHKSRILWQEKTHYPSWCQIGFFHLISWFGCHPQRAWVETLACFLASSLDSCRSLASVFVAATFLASFLESCLVCLVSFFPAFLGGTHNVVPSWQSSLGL